VVFILQAIYKKKGVLHIVSLVSEENYSTLFTAAIPSPLVLIAGADFASNKNVISATFLLFFTESCTNCSETMKIGLLVAAKICGPFSSYSSFVAK
jgi:hypothetical protein